WMLIFGQQTSRKSDCSAAILLIQRDRDERAKRHPIETIGIVHSVPQLERFGRELFRLWVILLPPCTPRQACFCHRNIFYHPEFRGEFERSLRFSSATRDVTQPAKRHRSVSQA